MKSRMRLFPAAFLVLMFTGFLISLPRVSFAAANSIASPAQQDAAESAAAARLNKSQFKDVKVSVDANGIASLTGTVSLYEYKSDAEKRIRKAKGVSAVRNLIEVNGPNVSDSELKAKLAEKLAYDRVGYGNPFNAITLGVQSGAVTLGGHARTDIDKDSAVALVSTYPGVKDVVDEIEVDPVSIMDDQARMAVARAIYGYPTLNKYSIDPAKPIWISVQNGNVELYGVVDSQADKDVAGIRANGVSGIFSVKNYIQVAGQPAEKANGQTQK